MPLGGDFIAVIQNRVGAGWRGQVLAATVDTFSGAVLPSRLYVELLDSSYWGEKCRHLAGTI